MNPRTILLAVMSAVLLANRGTAAGCDDGWFGKGCRYKCRCARTTSCSSNGSCSRCKRGWFGPACQYDDLAFNQVTQPYAGDLTDANEITCVTPSRLQGNQVTVILERIYLFTWLRVHINASATDLLHQLEVFFGHNASLPCMNPRNASLDQRTLDIHCDVDGAVQEVTLRGEAVPYLCSVYISGGRNVALKQKASQSSTYIDDYTAYTADKAVDGNTDTDFYKLSCSSTKHEFGSPRRAHWNVTFDQPSYTTRYVLYNRKGNAPNRLKKFYLQSFGKMNDQVFNYTDTSRNVLSTYTMIPNKVTLPVTSVNLQENNGGRMLTLCEVEIYGDSSCDVGKYGRDCEHDCWCAQGEQCFVSTGGCPSGCAPGFHGESCHTKLPSNDNMDAAVVVATVVGGVGVMVLLVVAVVFWRRLQTAKSETRGEESYDNNSLSRIDLNEVHRTLPIDGYIIPVDSAAVIQRAAQMGSQGNFESEDIVGEDCAPQSCDDSVDHTYTEICDDSFDLTYTEICDDSVDRTYLKTVDDLASSYEAVVDDSNKDITSRHNCPECINTL